MKKNKKQWGIVITEAKTPDAKILNYVNTFWGEGDWTGGSVSVDSQNRSIYPSKKAADLAASSCNSQCWTWSARVLPKS